MKHYKRTQLLLTLAILIACIVVGCSSRTDRTPPTINLSWRWLWNPETDNPEDWQILDQPSHIIRGLHGDLFIADQGNARVIRINTNGEFIEAVGSEGEGPGEFLRPTFLTIDPQTHTFFVADKSTSRINLFRIGINKSDFISSHLNQAYSRLSVPSLVPDGNSILWTTGFAASSRIRKISLAGEVQVEFGDPWIIEDLRPLSLDLLNRGLIVELGNGNLGYIWQAKPVVEIWSKQGTLLHTAEIQSPEVQIIDDYQKENNPADLGREWVPFYFNWADCLPAKEAIFIGFAMAENAFTFYELSSENLRIVSKYICSETPEYYRIENCVAELTEDGIRFFALDRYNGGIAVLETIQE